MFRHIIFALLFIVINLIQVSFIQSLPIPFKFFHLDLLIGIFILQKRHALKGIAWMSLIPFFNIGFSYFRPITYLLSSLLAAIIGKYIFARNSIYALLGMTMSVIILFYAMNGLHSILFYQLFERIPDTVYPGEIVQSSLFTTLGMLIIFLTSRIMEKRWRFKFSS